MIRIIVSEKGNGRCYTFEIIDNIYCLFGLNKCVKNRLLAKEKEIKKVWNEGTKLTANIYLDRNFAGSIDFEL